jgi:hypothetical protein
MGDLAHLCDELELDLCLARLAHLAARQRLGLEETAENRAAVLEWQARVDVILDLLVELRGPGPSIQRTAGVSSVSPRG